MDQYIHTVEKSSNYVPVFAVPGPGAVATTQLSACRRSSPEHAVAVIAGKLMRELQSSNFVHRASSWPEQ